MNLDENQNNEIKKMIQKQKENFELEVSFKNIDYQNYIRISQHFINIVSKSNINIINSLDVSILLTDNNVYRVSFYDPNQIDKIITNGINAETILTYEETENIKIIYKNRGEALKLYIEDFDIFFKLTEESPVSYKPKLNGKEKIFFRYKNRYSFNVNEYIRIDISDVLSSNNLSILLNNQSIYEIEMEVIKKIKLNNFLEETNNVLQIVQNTKNPIGKQEMLYVINKYYNLLNIKNAQHLDSRNPISIERQYIINYIPNKYAITDKADGERHFLLIFNKNAYLLSFNLKITKVNLNVNLDNVILDGELIKDNDKLIFLAFDVVYYEDDYRYNKKYNLIYRVNKLNEIIKKIGTLIDFPNYLDKNKNVEIKEIENFYKKELEIYWKKFKKIKREYFFVTRKIYFIPYGIDSSEVFTYANLLWKSLVYKKLTPYKLDGIIYTPLDSSYLIKYQDFESTPLEYKWKPPIQNSIDFFILIDKDVKGNEIIFYDNSIKKEGNAFKICNLYVGLNKNGQEKPVKFKVNGIDQKANIYMIDDEIRDIEGNIINDNTVVEFIFDTSLTNIDNAYKWIPIKTRYDKTESVQKYKKRYGNIINIAQRIWKTITDPITEEIIASLSNPSTYKKQIEQLKVKPETKEENYVYYQKKTDNAIGMRAFNNFIKANIIMTYAKNKKNVLDIGCGRGGDLIKFINAKIEEYVGIDIDNNGLYIINDSANNRYLNLKNTRKVPPMYFINADARALFKNQDLVIPNMTKTNKILIEKYLTKKYEIINAQFSIHYFLSDELTWNNFTENINNTLDDNGYFLITCFDGQLIYDKLKEKMTISYTDDHGQKQTFFEIIQIYSEKSDIGMGIDLYNSLISNPGNYNREYLVFPHFLEKSLKEKCNLELVESDSFYNLFNLYKNLFKKPNHKNYKENTKGLHTFKKDEIQKFYRSLIPNDNSDIHSGAVKASFKFSMLNRYYIFKKGAKTNQNRISNSLTLDKILIPYLDNRKIMIDLSKNDTVNNIYNNVKREYKISPSVYLIKKEDKLKFYKIKDGNDKVLLIYKDKYFYPIYYEYNNNYLFDKKIIKDIDILVALTEKLY